LIDENYLNFFSVLIVCGLDHAWEIIIIFVIHFRRLSRREIHRNHVSPFNRRKWPLHPGNGRGSRCRHWTDAM